MKRILFMLVQLGVVDSATAGERRNLERANGPGAIGEAGSQYVTPPGVFFHPLYNDVSGGTDKLLSESAQLGRLWQYSDSSYELRLRWRFLTPVYKRAFGHQKVERVIGRYADWMELSHSYARTLHGLGLPLKVQGSLGGNHVGNKGAKQVHTWVHQVTGNETVYLQYTNQPTGYFLNAGAMVALLPSAFAIGKLRCDWAPAAGFDHSRFMQESYVALNLVSVIRQGAWEMGAEARLVRQHASEVYDGIQPGRYELAFSTLLFHWNKPTIKYVSAYLKGDRIGQTYFDFLNVQIPL